MFSIGSKPLSSVGKESMPLRAQSPEMASSLKSFQMSSVTESLNHRPGAALSMDYFVGLRATTAQRFIGVHV